MLAAGHFGDGAGPADREQMSPESEGLRGEIRRMVLEELSRIVKR
jgi:hypothetical protein